MRNLVLFIIALFSLVNTQAQENHLKKDEYQITFITNIKKLPDNILQSKIRNQENWQKFIAENGKWNVAFNEINGKPVRAFGNGIETYGTSIEERAENFLKNNLQNFAPEYNTYVLQGITTSKYHYITYTQQYKGLDVLFSNAKIRMTKDDYKVIMFGLETFSDISVNTTPAFTTSSAVEYATSDFSIPVTGTEVQDALAVLPVQDADKKNYSFKLVYTVLVNTIDAENIPGRYYTLVDAHTGEVLYRINEVKSCMQYMLDATADIQASITDNPLIDQVVRGLPYIRVTIDGLHYYADENGILSLPDLTEEVTGSITLRGRYAQVFDSSEGDDMETIAITLYPGENLIAFDTESGAKTTEVSAYYHQNIIHDHMKNLYPGFSSMDVSKSIYVDRTDGVCNAFYDGSSTNFYAEGSGCLASALFSDVVYHEYGHGINHNLYPYLAAVGGMSNGAMHEGYADIWAFTITENPILAQGWNGTSGSFIRKYDGSPKVYPDNITGEVHNDGEIIAGAWWDLYENLGYDMDAMVAIWSEAQYGTPDGPYGSEGTIFSSVLIDALLADDDDADPSNGTPNMLAILEAFAEHGIGVLGEVSIEHTETTEPLPADESVILYAYTITEFPLYAEDVKIHYRTNTADPFTVANMYTLSEENYFVNLGIQAPGTIIEYYFELRDIWGNLAVNKPEKTLDADPNLRYFAMVGFDKIATEDFDNTMGTWLVNPFGDDDNTAGTWTVASPIQTFDIGSVIVQPGVDHTEGTTNYCAVTGNAAGPININDVDSGKTTLQSPYFDASNLDEPVLTYYRWFINDSPTSANKGNDPWQVFITNNGIDWVPVEHTYTSDNSWRKNIIRIADYVTPTETVALLFVANDSTLMDEYLAGQSTVEAAVDDVQLWGANLASSINELNVEDFVGALYPNPAQEFFTIQLNAQLLTSVEIEIYNALGAQVKSVYAENVISILSIDIQNLPAGVYTAAIHSDGKNANRQLIIQKP